MKKVRLIQILTIAALLISLLGPGTALQAAASQEDLPVNPALLQMAQEKPASLFSVIVQKASKEKTLEKDVEAGGGKVKKHLELITSFSAEMTGKEVLKLARHKDVRWISFDAPILPASFMGNTVRDEFTTASFEGNNGSETWSTPWIENDGSSSSPNNGDFRISNSPYCASGYCLAIGESSGAGKNFVGDIQRKVNLKNITSATLSFSYRRNAGTGLAIVFLSVSKNDGASWTTLAQYSLLGSDSGQVSQSFDLTQYASKDTVLRFTVAGYFPANSTNLFFVDDLQIEYQQPVSEFQQTIRATQLFAETGLTGQGITVAVLDTGITDQADLSDATGASRLLANVQFGNSTAPSDGNGHGTHVAGILAANGNTSNGLHKGVASGVNLVNVKISDDDGRTLVSSMVEGLQWIFNNRAIYNIRVVNISFNQAIPEPYLNSPLDAAVEILWFNGIVVVVSAGNNGTADGPSILYPPANDPFVITVGAAEDQGTVPLNDDFVGAFSAYGITEDGFSKPDIVAPGRNIISLSASANSKANLNHPKHRMPNDTTHFRMTGTSMAAPMVSGAAALLLQDEPGLIPDQVKYRLMATANQNWPGYVTAKAGAGYLDVYAAVFGATTGYANTGIIPSSMLATGENAVAFDSVGWNSVGWNSVGWNSVGWNSVGWNSVGWNSVGWNSVGWNSVGWNSSTWDD